MADGKPASAMGSEPVSIGERERMRFLAIYDARAPAVYRYLLSRLGNPAEAQDLTSQTVLTAWENFPRYREDGRGGAWLMAIARSKLVDYLRREKRRPEEMFFPETGGGLSEEEVDRRRRLQEEIRSLPESDRELLRLRYTAGLPIGEIAALTGRGEEAVKKHYQRLIGRLRTRMEVDHG
jgi:RNA polymerase sigma-70 factor (ECF subfamily)